MDPRYTQLFYRSFLLLGFLVLWATTVFSQGGGPPVRMSEIDGSPNVNAVRWIRVTNGALSCTGTTCILTTGAGGGGDVSGPASSTDNAIARFDSTTGKIIQNSIGILGDDGTLTLGGGVASAELRILEPSGGGSSYTGFKAPALGSNVLYTLPTAIVTDGYLKTDGSGVLSWATASGILPITPIVSGDFSWFNQGGASLEASNGHVALIVPDSSGDNLRIREKNTPVTPYTITVAFNLLVPAEDFSSAGLVLRDSVGGGLVTLRLEFGTTPDVDVSKWTNATTFNSTYAATTTPMNPLSSGLLYLRFTDNGTNRISYMSYDGVNFIQIHSVSRTDFITPDKIGFYVDVNAVTTGAIGTFYSWTQS